MSQMRLERESISMPKKYLHIEVCRRRWAVEQTGRVGGEHVGRRRVGLRVYRYRPQTHAPRQAR